MTRSLAVMSALLAIGVSSGCRIPSAGITEESYPRPMLKVNSKMVGSRIELTEYNAKRLNGQIQLQLTVKNFTTKDIQFEYRVEWKDKDGVAIETPLTTWIPFSLSGKESKALKVMAPGAMAEDFTFIVRFSRPSTRW